MLRSLRNRLVLSHVLPLLIIVPLMGIALIYVLETQYVLPSLSKNLVEDATLIADLARDYPGIWNDPQLAKDLLGRLSLGAVERIMLVTKDGILLGSTDPADLSQVNQLANIPGLSSVLKGEVYSTTRYSQRLKGEVIDVVAPVKGQDGSVLGIVRLTYHYETFYEEFIRLRYLIGSIFFVSLIVGVGLGLFLAVNIGRPIQRVTQAVQELASGRRTDPLPESGSDEVRQLQQAANHLVERLHTLEESRRKLLANLVHELGRPLGALRAAIQALQRGAKDNPELLAELLQGMEYEAILLQRVTEDLSHLHEQLLGPLELDIKPVSLEEWLGPVLVPWQASALENRLRWTYKTPGNLPVVKADPDRLAQALGNLVSNAIRYTPPGGEVTVTAGSEGPEAWIRVSDTGPGVPVEEQEKIFTPFFRGSHGRRFPQGMGLGLSIAHDLVEAHGGRIELESTPGLGSCFTIWLPTASSE